MSGRWNIPADSAGESGAASASVQGNSLAAVPRKEEKLRAKGRLPY